MIRIVSMFALAALALAAYLVGPALAAENAKKINIGDACPAFTNLPGTDGKKHSLSDLKKDVVVIVVTCNKCPVAIAYEPRIVKFANKYKDKVDFVAISVSNDERDNLARMTERAKEAGFTFPYLHDESQNVGRALGATATPHFFVLNKERKLVYRGAMDDNTDASAVTKNYLDSAVTAALAGETLAPTSAETKARGCGVTYSGN